MGKPWARFDQNFINHPKFMALDKAAICLWLEGKNYCDMQITDGLIPRAALKTFRFHTRSAVDALLRSCGDKPNGTPYAPLWAALGVTGFRMHDYLDHNDCRDVVLGRIAGANAERDRKKVNQQLYRDRQKQDRDRSRDDNASSNGDREKESSLPDKQQHQQKQLHLQEERTRAAHTSGGVMAGMLPRDHARHAICGRVCLHHTQFSQFVLKIGGNREHAEIQIATWAKGLLETWDLPPLANRTIQGTTFQWWDARWEEWQGSPKAAPAAPGWRPSATAAHEWTCPHTPHCSHRAACAIVSQRPA